MNNGIRHYAKKLLLLLPYLILASGILLRLALYFQCRSLTNDEANVARNLNEKNLLQLIHHLDYETYAPPLFIMASKGITFLLGFSEYALRLLPLTGGIISLLFLFLILKHLSSYKSLWYPLLLYATGFIYLRYATETKQYATDAAVCLGLMLMAVKPDIIREKPVALAIKWILAGTFAIWFCMPSLFILAGIGSSFLYQSLTYDKTKARIIAIVIFIWIAQFALYYFLNLKTAIGSDYLQNWHKDYFIVLFPLSWPQLAHNLDLINMLLENAGGKTAVAIGFHLALMIAGCISLYRRNRSLFLLFIIPVVSLFAASGLHKYNLLPRVSLFIFPVFMIFIASGAEKVMNLKNTWIRYPFIAIAIVCFINFNQFVYLLKPYENEAFKKGLDIAMKENIAGNHLLLNRLVIPSYIYYTEIHPRKERWNCLTGAVRMTYGLNYDSLVQTFSGRNGILYEWVDQVELKSDLSTDNKYSRNVTIHPFAGGELVVTNK